MTVVARELRVEDLEAVNSLRAKYAMSLPTAGQWQNLHNANPARAEVPGVPLGWVLEDDGIVGCFVNVPMRWSLRGKLVRVAASSGWVVAESHRHSSFQLMTRYFSQRGVELLLNWSANPSSGKAFEAFKGKAVPISQPSTILTWLVRPSAAGGYLEGRVPGLVKSAVVRAARVAEQGLRLILRPRPGVTVLTAPDERIDVLWHRLRADSPRCIQYRDAATYRWLFDGLRSDGRLIVLEKGGQLAGSAMLVRRDHKSSGLTRHRLVDLQAVGDDPHVIRELARAALRLAFEEGVGVVEAIGFHPAKRRALQSLLPLRRKLPLWPYYYRAKGELAGELASEDAWDPCSVEGDGVIGLF